MVERTIVTANLCKSFGDKEAIKMVNLQIKTGEVYGLIGAKGTGTSTILNMLAGVIEPTSGTVYISGIISAEDEHWCKQQVGYLPRQVGFYEGLSARENLEFFASLYNLSREEGRFRTSAVLREVGLAEHADRRVKSFTSGMVQRLGLAKALLHDPGIILLDEPENALDLEGMQILRRLISRWKREGKTVVIGTAHFSVVREFCTSVGVLVDGRVTYEGALGDLMSVLEGKTWHEELTTCAPQLTQLDQKPSSDELFHLYCLRQKARLEGGDAGAANAASSSASAQN